MSELKGIDISKWQQGLDLSKVDCDFVIIKATEGVGYVDPCCEVFFQKALQLGKKIGFYHFARPTKGKDPVKEARFFYEKTKNYFGKGIPVLDWEAEQKSNTAWAKAFLDEVYKLSGVKPLIYMSQSVVNSYDWSAVAKADYGLWVAKYRDNNPDYNYDMKNAGSKPSVKWWKFYALWQWTSKGILNGWKGNLDCDVFYGDAKTWDAYVGIASAPVQTPAQNAQNAQNPLDKYSDEELAMKVLNGEFGNGNERKKALGNRYAAVQKIVDQKIKEQNQPKAVYHIVKKGDILSVLAKKYGTTVSAICKLNNIKNANMIIIGQKLRVK